MAARIVSETHVWVIATTVEVDARDLPNAIRRGRYTVEHGTTIQVVEAYCSQCRRTYAQLIDVLECAAAASNDHLIGGPTGERKKRVHDKPGHNCKALGCVLDVAAARAAVSYDGVS